MPAVMTERVLSVGLKIRRRFSLPFAGAPVQLAHGEPFLVSSVVGDDECLGESDGPRPPVPTPFTFLQELHVDKSGIR